MSVRVNPLLLIHEIVVLFWVILIAQKSGRHTLNLKDLGRTLVQSEQIRSLFDKLPTLESKDS